ncbi:MAG: APC family permease [Nocardioidaceae bacterium]
MNHASSNTTGGTPDLQGNALSAKDLLIAGMSYMAPGFSFFFTTALVAASAGIFMPISYVLAGLGVLCTGYVFAEFSKFAPSAGALQVFVDRGFGRIASIGAGLVLLAGYLCLQTGVLALFGGWTSHLIDRAFGFEIPWPLLSVIGMVAVTALMVRGVQMSVRATWVLFLSEFVLVVLVAVVVLMRGGDSGLSAAPFHLTDLGDVGWSGIALGMVFCVFSFVGFEGAISFAEETPNPAKAMPIAVLGGVAVIAVLYVVGTYAAVVGFGIDNIDALAGDAEPISTLADRYSPILEPLLAVAVLTSIVANLTAAGNANARVLFNMGREGAVPAVLGRVESRYRTPAIAIVTFMLGTLILALAAATRWDYATSFGYIAGLGALLALLIYMLATVALPFYVIRSGQPLRPVPHVFVPVLGAGIWLVPMWGTLKPGQSWPASIYPGIAIGLVVVVGLYAVARSRRTPGDGAVGITAFAAEALRRRRLPRLPRCRHNTQRVTLGESQGER